MVKVFCKNGHDKTPDNILIKGGWSICKTCWIARICSVCGHGGELISISGGKRRNDWVHEVCLEKLKKIANDLVGEQ